jgi:hypothetical protein
MTSIGLTGGRGQWGLPRPQRRQVGSDSPGVELGGPTREARPSDAAYEWTRPSPVSTPSSWPNSASTAFGQGRVHVAAVTDEAWS